LCEITSFFLSDSICRGYSMRMLVGLLGRKTLGMAPLRNGGPTPLFLGCFYFLYRLFLICRASDTITRVLSHTKDTHTRTERGEEREREREREREAERDWDRLGEVPSVDVETMKSDRSGRLDHWTVSQPVT